MIFCRKLLLQCVKLHGDDATDYDVVNWNVVNRLRLRIGKNTLAEKCLLTRAVEALDAGDYNLASDLQVEIQQLLGKYRTRAKIPTPSPKECPG